MIQSRQPSDGIEVEERSSCILCGSRGESLYSDLRDRFCSVPGTWSLLCCPKDGLVWLDPQPVLEDIGKLYPEYCTHTVTHPVTLRFGRVRKMVKQAILAEAFGYNELATSGAHKALGWVCSRIAPLREVAAGTVMWLHASWRGDLLDVGCGNGNLVAPLRDMGWDVTGVDSDPIPVKLAQEQFGLKVHEGALENVHFPARSFNAVTMHHVIEHLPDPIKTLGECWRILSPGGKLVVVTPNIGGLGFRLFGNAWAYLDPPRHLTLFSLGTLARCVEMAGFHVANIHTSPRHAHMVWVDSRSIRRNGVYSRRHTEKVLPPLAGLAFMGAEWCSRIVMKNAGEELVLIAEKERSTCSIS